MHTTSERSVRAGSELQRTVTTTIAHEYLRRSAHRVRAQEESVSGRQVTRSRRKQEEEPTGHRARRRGDGRRRAVEGVPGGRPAAQSRCASRRSAETRHGPVSSVHSSCLVRVAVLPSSAGLEWPSGFGSSATTSTVMLSIEPRVVARSHRERAAERVEARSTEDATCCS